MTTIKVCGVTSVADALACADLGVEAVGLNFVPGSPRQVSVERARAIAEAVGRRVLLVGVVADLSVPAMRALREAALVECLQLHGDESPADVAALLPHAYKAVRIATASDVAIAAAMPGPYVLVDAKVPGALGGTGHRVDGSLVLSLARTRRLALAGGLTPENVKQVIADVRPFCVDVASGVESAPGVKDRGKLAAFVAAVRSHPAFSASPTT